MARRIALAAVLLAVLAVPAAAVAQLPPFDPDPVPVPVVDCADPALRCPDLEMRAPYDLSVQRTPGGRSLLRSANAILSVGRGPVALLGDRSTSSTRLRTMRVRQRIATRSGGHVEIDSPGRIVWKPIPGQGGYWKFENAARFELWTMGAGRRLVRTGPKVVYCFRDLQHVRPSARSPRARVFGACSQVRTARHVRLGTSVGWADVYPATYHEQYVDVTGLRGCFALWHIADPFNAIRESDETDNAARTIVTLRPGRSPVVGRCV
jgi:hypothetical protein